MIRVVHCISDTNFGGAGRLLLNQLAASDRSRFDLWVLLPPGSALTPHVRACGVKAIEIQVRGDKAFVPRDVGAYAGLFRRLQPDIVHCHGALTARVAAYLCGVPVRIHTRHCAYPLPGWQRRGPGHLLSAILQNTLSTYTIATAEAARGNLLESGVDPERIAVILNGTPPLKRPTCAHREQLLRGWGVPDGVFVLGMAARLETCKGHETLLRAFAVARGEEERRGRGKDLFLLLAGEGTQRAELERLTADLGLERSVRFLGFVEDMSSFFGVLDLNVNASSGTETSCLALSEGMSLGLPAVATDYGGNPGMVVTGENGILVPTGDALAMADAICRLVDAPALYSKLSAGAFARYREKYTASGMAKKLEAVYDSEMKRVTDAAIVRARGRKNRLFGIVRSRVRGTRS